jgi:hypothetical protein
MSRFQGTVARSELDVTCLAQVLSYSQEEGSDAQGERSKQTWIRDEVETEALNATWYSLNTLLLEALIPSSHTF